MLVGFGEKKITPPLGIPGALGLDNEIREIFDDIYARVVVFKDDDSVGGLISLDLVGLHLSEVL